MTASPTVLRELMALGRSGRPGIPASLPDHAAWERFENGPTSWRHVGKALREDELDNLIRGLTLYFRASGQPTSLITSPIVALFQQFSWTYPAREAELGAWIVKYRTSPHDPLGVVDEAGSSTWAEYQSHQIQHVRSVLDEALTTPRRRAVHRGDKSATKALRRTTTRSARGPKARSAKRSRIAR